MPKRQLRAHPAIASLPTIASRPSILPSLASPSSLPSRSSLTSRSSLPAFSAFSLFSIFSLLTTVALLAPALGSQAATSESKSTEARPAGDFAWQKAVARDTSGRELAYEIGRIRVPEVRGAAGSRTIGVGFARFAGPEGPPPIFVLPGGPGYSYISDMLAHPRGQAGFADFVRHLTRVATVVLVDQRGCSSRGDVLTHRFVYPALGDGELDSEERECRLAAAQARSAVEAFAATETDLRGYTVRECAADVDALRAALGYDKITLVGTSYGSQWSFACMRLFPERVARALLSGVEPLDHAFDMPSDILAAHGRVWQSLEADEAWRPYLPEGGIAQALRCVRARLDDGPLSLGKDGEREVFLTPPQLWVGNPREILELYHGHYDACRARIARRARGGPSNGRILGALIDSSLYVTPERLHRLWNDAATRFLGRLNFAPSGRTKDIWPSEDVGDEFRRPQRCEVPVVFAQGDWDTSTPLENTYEIAPYFVRSRVLIAERGGHGVLRPIQNELPRVWEELAEFLRSGDMDDIPVRVRLQPSRRFDAPSFELPAKSRKRG